MIRRFFGNEYVGRFLDAFVFIWCIYAIIFEDKWLAVLAVLILMPYVDRLIDWYIDRKRKEVKS